MGLRYRRAALFWVAAVVAGAAVAGRASAGPAPSSSAASPPSATPSGDLPALPELEPIRVGEADAASEKDLEALLSQLTSSKQDIRDHAREAIADVPASLLPAIRARLEEIHASYDKKVVPLLLADDRKAARAKRKASGKDDAPAEDDRPKKSKKKHAKDKDKDADASKDKSRAPQDDDETGDWLSIVLSEPRPNDDNWKHLVEILAMERMLAAIGTTPAVMEMLNLRATFGDMLRIDLARQLARLGDRAVPGLIESRNHKASVVRELAEQTLDKMKKTVPGEAVGTDDPDVLADVLRAFGHTRDVDAVHVALSYASSDRKKLRDAARQAIVGIGDAGKWQLREAYQDLTGEKPEKSAPWDQLARQIFATYDKARLAAFEKVVSDGMAAQAQGNHADAVKAFDQVLAEDPLYEKRKAMAPSYAAVAMALPAEQAEQKLAMLRKAERLDPDGSGAKQIESQIALTEAKLLIHDHRPDRFLLERAVELDASNQEAKDLLASFEEKAVEVKSNDTRRFLGAGAIFVGMLASVLTIGFWGRKKRPSAPPPAPAPTNGESAKAE